MKPTRIVIIGDKMRDIDQYMIYVKDHEGTPVYSYGSIIERVGGSEAVAEMCQTIGADVLSLGLDESIKRRVFLDGILSLRVDDDRKENPTTATLLRWCRDIAAFEPDLILICDHAKGVITSETMRIAYTIGAPVYVDPCINSDWSIFQLADCISANRNEWANATTEGAGMAIRRLDKDGVEWEGGRVAATCREVVDTVGAGDQFLAVLAFMRASGAGWKKAITAANYAAGLQCERHGIIPVRLDEIPSNLLDLKSPHQTLHHSMSAS